MRFFLCTFALLLLAACGGGGNAADEVPAEAKFIPDFSTPEGATLAFLRAIETNNTGLLSMTLLDDEREAVLPRYEILLSDSRKAKIDWELEQVDNYLVPGKQAHSLLKWHELEAGKRNGNWRGGWYVFVKTNDGSWKLNSALSKQVTTDWVARQKQAAKAPANDVPGD